MLREGLAGPAELGYLPLTDAGIDLRMTIAYARRRGILSREAGKRLGDAVQGLNFRNRHLDACVDAAALCTSSAERSELIASLHSLRVPQKQADALTAIRHLASGHAPAPRGAISFEPTQAFISEVRAAGFDAQKILTFRL